MESRPFRPPSSLILGLRFFEGALEEAVEHSLGGGLILMPSGPGLAGIDRKPTYRDALSQADLLLADSGFLALLWKIRTGHTLSRISGYRFLHSLLRHPRFLECASTKSLWVLPDAGQAEKARGFLTSLGIRLPPEAIYLAPLYQREAITDSALLETIRTRRPYFVMIGLGGDVQEPLGRYLATQLDYRPAVICSGAAIAFLSGAQTRIPLWADRCFLGWLFRPGARPCRFAPRYFGACRLLYLVFRYGRRPPGRGPP